MKKLILLAFAAVMMVGCSTDGRNYETLNDKGDICTIKIDSCEYIKSHVYYGAVITHKNDCRFCKERRQKELEELVIKLKEK